MIGGILNVSKMEFFARLRDIIGLPHDKLEPTDEEGNLAFRGAGTVTKKQFEVLSRVTEKAEASDIVLAWNRIISHLPLLVAGIAHLYAVQHELDYREKMESVYRELGAFTIDPRP